MLNIKLINNFKKSRYLIQKYECSSETKEMCVDNLYDIESIPDNSFLLLSFTCNTNNQNPQWGKSTQKAGIVKCVFYEVLLSKSPKPPNPTALIKG